MFSFIRNTAIKIAEVTKHSEKLKYIWLFARLFVTLQAIKTIDMEKQKDNTLLKARSYRSVLATGFRLYTENFRRLFKASWQMALLYALSCGALGTLAAIKIPELTAVIMKQVMQYQGVFIQPLLQYATTLLAFIALCLLAVATLALASATILAKLKEHKETGSISTPPHWLTASPLMMGRTLKGVFCTLLVVLMPYILATIAFAVAVKVKPEMLHGNLITIVATLFIVFIIVMAFALPLMHVLMKYLMEAPCNYWRTLGSYYGRALSHWGMLFLVFFVSILIVELASLVVMLPAHVLNMANQSAHNGMLLGDPLGMPSYMTALTFVTFTFCCFIEFYIGQVVMVHNYYVYGSIEAKEQERASSLSVDTKL